jgi:hypothetical protein
VKTAEEAFEYIFAPKSPDDTPVEIPPEKPEKNSNFAHGKHPACLEKSACNG